LSIPKPFDKNRSQTVTALFDAFYVKALLGAIISQMRPWLHAMICRGWISTDAIKDYTAARYRQLRNLSRPFVFAFNDLLT
jgi:hypothetical protein